MSKKNRDYYSVVEQIMREPESYENWSSSSSNEERREIEDLIKDSFDVEDPFDY